jgi:archaellum component FlaG (FlaF/FlaG flagellin family)
MPPSAAAVATTAVSAFTYPTPSCTVLPNALVSYTRTTLPSTWTSYQYNITATSNIATIRFRLQAGTQKEFYVDNVHIVSVNNPSVSLIVNGDFEQASAVGWNLYGCSPSCSTPGSIVSSGSCHSGSRCYLIDTSCGSSQILQQSFYTIAGQQYRVSFDLVGLPIGGASGSPLNAEVAIA